MTLGGALDMRPARPIAAPTYRLGHRPALDGLRGVAVFLVLVAHANLPYAASAGMVGVTLFFVLSGFLITQLLTEEGERTGRVDLVAFYRRRVRRLVPALLVFVGVVAAISMGPKVTPWWALIVLTYTTNLFGITGDLGVLGHTWSLAMEEQFYLVWPLVLVWVGRRRPGWLIPGLVVAIALVSMNRVHLLLSGAGTYRVLIAPDTRADGLLVGCLLALIMPRLAGRPLGRYSAAGALVLLAIAPCAEHLEGLTLIPAMIAGAAVVAWGASVRSAGCLTSRPLLRLGRISYGLYLWHFPITRMLWYQHVPWGVNLAITAVLSILLATLSWRYVEAPILARGRARRAALATA